MSLEAAAECDHLDDRHDGWETQELAEALHPPGVDAEISRKSGGRGRIRVVVRRRVVVHGRVQGVFFRDSTRRLAQQYGVAGWVSNRWDGTVEAVFEGDEYAVERLVRFMREGPRGAHVERVEVFDEGPERLAGFDVR